MTEKKSGKCRHTNPFAFMRIKSKERYLKRKNSIALLMETTVEQAVNMSTPGPEYYSCMADPRRPFDDMLNYTGYPNTPALCDITRKCDAISKCNTYPFFGKCKNTTMCELCLSKWRYGLMKTLEYLHNQWPQTYVTFRRRTYYIPRGVFVNKSSEGRLIASYQLSGYDMNPSSYSYVLRPFQNIIDDGVEHFSNIMSDYYHAIFEGPQIYDPEKEKDNPPSVATTLQRRKELADSITLSTIRGDEEIFTGNYLKYSIMQSLLMERKYFSSMRDLLGSAHRITWGLDHSTHMLFISLSSILLSMPLLASMYGSKYAGDISLLRHLAHVNEDGTVGNHIGAKHVRLSKDSKLYCTRDTRLVQKDFDVRYPFDKDEWLRYIEETFGYCDYLRNFTPLEFLVFEFGALPGLKRTSLAGVFRDFDGEEAEESDSEVL